MQSRAHPSGASCARLAGGPVLVLTIAKTTYANKDVCQDIDSVGLQLNCIRKRKCLTKSQH